MSNYNGWTNYETWVVNLWMSNDSGSVDYWDEQSREFLDEADGDKDDAAYMLAQRLENDHTDLMPETVDVFADLLGHALRMVDWREIAHHLIDAVYEEWKESQTEGEAE